jgi:hypothetical protein
MEDNIHFWLAFCYKYIKIIFQLYLMVLNQDKLSLVDKIAYFHENKASNYI